MAITKSRGDDAVARLLSERRRFKPTKAFRACPGVKTVVVVRRTGQAVAAFVTIRDGVKPIPEL